MTPDPSVSTRVAGETFTLLPERAAYWEARSTLFIADAHFGKAATFRAFGVPVPRGTTLDGLTRAAAILERTRARRLVFLGDLLHAREGRHPDTFAQLAKWRERFDGVEMLLVRGNHDARAGDPPAGLGIRCVDEPFVESPFVFAHHPRPHAGGYVLAGHIHPAVKLRGRGRQRLQFPCFWFGADAAVLPAFGDFTGTAVIHPRAEDDVFAITSDGVIPLTTT